MIASGETPLICSRTSDGRPWITCCDCASRSASFTTMIGGSASAVAWATASSSRVPSPASPRMATTLGESASKSPASSASSFVVATERDLGEHRQATRADCRPQRFGEAATVGIVEIADRDRGRTGALGDAGPWQSSAASRSGPCGRTTGCRGSRRAPARWRWASRSGRRRETGTSRSLSATIDDAGPMIASTPPVMSESKPIAADAAVAPSSASINSTSDTDDTAGVVDLRPSPVARPRSSPRRTASRPARWSGAARPARARRRRRRAGGLVVVTTAWVVVGALSSSSEQLIAATATAPTHRNRRARPVGHRLTIEERSGSAPSRSARWMFDRGAMEAWR